jgi:hypothetical protein
MTQRRARATPGGPPRVERGSDGCVQQQLDRPRDGDRCDSNRCLDSDRPRVEPQD